MSIVGTIVTVEELLKQDQITMSIETTKGRKTSFELKQNRSYIVPDFQREIKWEIENIVELINDIYSGSKFLGNIILSENTNSEYRIIDGQQRITIINMLIDYLRNTYGEILTDIIVTCDFKIESFELFREFTNNKYTLYGLDDTQCEKFRTSDIYHQINQYEKLYNAIINCNIINEENSRQFYKNLKKCTLNVINSTSDTEGESIEYFLDVNLKGVKLDNEDIFKAYLFDYDSEIDIRKHWKKFKENVFKLNDLIPGNKDVYPCMKIIEHYLYCDLFLDIKYKSLEMDENFYSKSIFKKGEKTFQIGTHIIKIINNNSYMKKMFKEINRYLEFIIDVLNSPSPSVSFVSFFKSVDDVERVIIQNIIRKTIMDSKLLLPKALIMKYMTYLYSLKEIESEDVKKIYSIFFLNTIFTLFETKKGKNDILNILKSNDWYEKIVSQSKSYFSWRSIVTNKFTSQYKYATNLENEEQKYRCKSLAAIYNYFEIKKDSISVSKGKFSELNRFLTDDFVFSIEHYIINDGSKLVIEKSDGSIIDYKYKTDEKKYAKSIFNFIFIPQEVNDLLGNGSVKKKTLLLKQKENMDKILCDYSKMVIKTADECFKENYKLRVIDQKILRNCEAYYSYNFIKEYNKFVEKILDNIVKKFKD